MGGNKETALDMLFSSLVDAGHRAVIFDRFRGVQDTVVGEGTHFLIPWVQKPIIFDCRSRPRNIPVITGSKGECLDPATIREPNVLMILFFFLLDVEIPHVLSLVWHRIRNGLILSF